MGVVSDLEKKTGKKLYVLSRGWEDNKEWEALSSITKRCSVNGGVTIDIEKLIQTPPLPAAETFSNERLFMRRVVERSTDRVLEKLREDRKMSAQLFFKLKEKIRKALDNEGWDCFEDEPMLPVQITEGGKTRDLTLEDGKYWVNQIIQYGALTKEGWRRKVWGDPDPQPISLPPEFGDSKIRPNTIAFLGSEKLNTKEFVKRAGEIARQGKEVNLANSDGWWMESGYYVPREEDVFCYYLFTARKLEETFG